MTRSQKRTFNQLLIFLIILVLLLTIALLVRRRMEASDADADSSAASSQTGQTQSPTISALSWHNGDTFQSFSAGEDGAWRWDGDKEFPLDTTVLDGMIKTLSPFTPVKAITAGDTLSAYGLENSSRVLTVEYQDGTSLQLTFGAQAPGSTDYYMLRGDDAATVYVMSSTVPDAMDTTVYDMMTLPVLPDMDSMSSISIESAGKTLTATSEDGSSWLCNGENISTRESLTNLLEALSAMEISRCENFKPSPDGLALWGMDVPAATLQVYYADDQLLTLQVGSQTLDGSGYYVRINDDTTIYSIYAYDIKPILNAAQNGFSDAASAAN